MFGDDMPPLVDRDSVPGGGGYIPPPMGAQSSWDPRPGSSSGYHAPAWASSEPPWATSNSNAWAGWGEENPISPPPLRRTSNGAYDFSSPHSSPDRHLRRNSDHTSSWGGRTPAWDAPSPWPQAGYSPSVPSPWPQPSVYAPAPYTASAPQSPYTASPWNSQSHAFAAPYNGAMVKSTSDYPAYAAASPYTADPHYQPLTRSVSASYGGKRKAYTSRTLAERPGDWRRDFSFRTGIAALLPRRRQSSLSEQEYTDCTNCDLHRNLLYNSARPPLILDLRDDPVHAQFFSLNKPFSMIDVMQFATSPPVPSMRLYHSHLPWYIDIIAQNPSGVTIHDLMDQLHRHLQRQISQKHYYNEETNEEDRRKVAKAFRERCGDDEGEISKGIRRVDFLRGRLMFEGLAKGKNGMWEIKTKKT